MLENLCCSVVLRQRARGTRYKQAVWKRRCEISEEEISTWFQWIYINFMELKKKKDLSSNYSPKPMDST